MGKLEAAIRAEVQRLARKEVRAQIEPLARQMRELRREIARVAKGGAAEAPAGEPAPPVELKADPKEVAKARFSAGLVKKLRKRLAITQNELATILNVSPTTVAFWEQGRNRPTDSSKEALVALRGMGRRDVKRILKARM